MSEPFVGQIIQIGFNFAPSGYALCNGATLLASQNQALYSLIGVEFGGVAGTNFKLPDLRGRAIIGQEFGSVDPAWQSPVVATGTATGTEAVTLTTSQMPPHNHLVAVSTGTATSLSPDGMLLAQTQGGGTSFNLYGPVKDVVIQGNISSTGGGAHNNMQPYLATNFAIAITGYYPPRP
jgi:microcystin-dependent protein